MGKAFKVIGMKTPRLDLPNKAMGKAPYPDDIMLPNVLYAKAVRSPYARARIRRFDTSKAAKLPGVKAIITANDVPHTHIFGIDGRDEPFLSWDGIVRYVGQQVAAVAVLDRDLAEDGAGLIEVEWEPLSAVLTAEEAVKTGAPLVHPEIPTAAGNVAFAVRLNCGDVEEGLRPGRRRSGRGLRDRHGQPGLHGARSGGGQLRRLRPAHRVRARVSQRSPEPTESSARTVTHGTAVRH